jgi:ribosomal protein L16 Arg81 hydroxylase
METDLLGWMLGPSSAPIFLREHWQRKMMLVQRNCPSYFHSFLQLQDLDRLISSVKLPATNFDLAMDSSPVPKRSYCVGPEIDLERALAWHRRGATIILRAIHNWCEPLQRLRLAAEAILRFPAQVNLYLTPEENQSTPPHWDTHDLFILQLEGDKVWRIYDSPRQLPLDDERFSADVYTVGPLRCEFTMKAGDVLYVPRGTIHEPRSISYSVHASLGVLVIRWADLLGEALRVASEEDVELRQAIEMPSGQSEVKNLISSVANRLVVLNDPRVAEQAVERVVRRFIETRDPDVSGDLLTIAKPRNLSGESIVGRRLGVCSWLERNESRSYLHWRTRTISMPIALDSMVQFIAERETFRVHELPGMASEDVKIATVTALIEDGLLEAKDRPNA